MSTVIPQSALPHKEVKRYGSMMTPARVIMKELSGLSIVQVSTWPGEEETLKQAIAKVADVEVSLVPGRAHTGDKATAIWAGPLTYLIVMESAEDGALYDALLEAVDGRALVSEQSAGRVAIRLTGSQVRELLMGECPVDLTEDFFKVGQVAATQWAHIPCLIHASFQPERTGTEFTLYCSRSFAQSLWNEMIFVGVEYGVQIVG